VKEKLESLQNRFWYYYSINADSAEAEVNRSLSILDTVKYPAYEVMAYVHLSELYQYRKPDINKASISLCKAIDVFSKNPSRYYLNSFMFIDVGNQFFNYGIFDKAISLYKAAFQLAANEQKGTHGSALSLQNIALSFQQIGQYDSTFYYLKTAERFLTNHEDIIYAQNLNYLAYLSLKKEFGVTAEKYAMESLTVLDKFRQNRQEMNGEGKKGRLYTDWSEIKSDAHSVLSTYYYQKDLYNLAKQQLDTAWFYAIESGVLRQKATLLSDWIYHDKLVPNNDTLKLKAAKAFELLSGVRDLKLQLAFTDSLVHLFAERKLVKDAARYAFIANHLGDSLKSVNASVETTRKMVTMASVVAEQTIQKLLVQEKMKSTEIGHKNKILMILIAVTILLALVMYIIIKQANKLITAYKSKVLQIQGNLQLNSRPNDTKPIPESTTLKMDAEFEKLMGETNYFLNKDLTLSQLAAKLKTNNTYLSNYLKNRHNITFTDLVNRHRIDEACRLLSLPENEKMSVDSLPQSCGFNSKSAFYKAFRKFTGMSPAAFQKSRIHD
jgi:YesN/AraC family two-component response regulator